MEEGWSAYGNCPECGGKLIKKKNRTGAMATVKHELKNDNCNFKFGSVHSGGKKGEKRTEEIDGKKAAAAAASGGGNPASGGTGAGKSTPLGKRKAAVTHRQDEGQNIVPPAKQGGNEPVKRESYSEPLKREYS